MPDSRLLGEVWLPFGEVTGVEWFAEGRREDEISVIAPLAAAELCFGFLGTGMTLKDLHHCRCQVQGWATSHGLEVAQVDARTGADRLTSN